MENRDKIIQGLEKAFQKLIEYKKYKKSPLITTKDFVINTTTTEKIQPAIYTHK